MIYLNNGSTTFPKPKQVINAVTKYLNEFPILAHRSGVDSERDDILTTTRKNLAKLLDVADYNRVFFTSGSTFAINMALRGIKSEGKHIVSTVIEHNSVIRPLEFLREANSTSIDYVECDSNGFVNPDDIKAAIRKDTVAIVINHCSNVTGTMQDLKTISAIAKEAGVLFIVDSSQPTGTVQYSINEIDPDILCITGHKSLYGLQGIGAIYIKEGVEIDPLTRGGTGSYSEMLKQPDRLPYKYESGTMNMPGLVSMNAGIEWIFETGMNEIIAHKKFLLNKLLLQYRNNPKIKIYSDSIHSSNTLFTFNIGDMTPEEVNFILNSSYDIQARSGLHCAAQIAKYIGAYPFGTVRISPSYFTTEDEIDVLIDAINKIMSFEK